MAVEFHPLSEIFPLLEGVEFTKLAEDIRRYGLHEPITLLDGRILDGRNRYRACVLTGVEPRYINFDAIVNDNGTHPDPLAWLARKNVDERHLTKAQLAAVALDILNLKAGGTYTKPASYDESVREIKAAADMVGVGWSSVERLVAIQNRRSDLIEMARKGSISISQASRQAGFNEYALDRAVPGVTEIFGKGDRFREATEPLVRYLNGWRGRGYEFRHVNPKEASQRLKVIDRLMEGLAEAREDLEARTVIARSSRK